MPVEVRDLSWKQTQEVTKAEGLAMSLATPESVQKLQTAAHPGRPHSRSGFSLEAAVLNHRQDRAGALYYSCQEALDLKVADIESKRMVIHIRESKRKFPR
jgi:hypothetical protein